MSDIFLEGIIGSDIKVEDVRTKLSSAVSPVKIHISSNGGSVVEGLALFNLINESPKEIHFIVEGIAASMAGFILPAANKVLMRENALIMLHPPRIGELQDATVRELKDATEALEKMEKSIIIGFAEKTNKTEGQVRQLMEGERFFTPEEAKAEGIVDEILSLTKSRKLDISSFNNVPDNILAFVRSFNGRDESMAIKDIAASLNLEIQDGAEDSAVEKAIVAAFTKQGESITALTAEVEKLKEKPPKKKEEVEIQKFSSSIVSMATNYRNTAIDSLVSEGFVTAAVAKELKTEFASEEAIEASLQVNGEDGFDKTVAIIRKNEKVVSYDERSRGQVIRQSSGEGSTKAGVLAGRMKARYVNSNTN